MVMKKRGVSKCECSKCGGELESHRIGVHSYCLKCHAEYMRQTRPKHGDLSEEARKKVVARAYTHVLIKRGKIVKEPCEVCGSVESQAHHDNYDNPRDVRWFCRPHHLEWHRQNGIVTT
jgi:hypothetical protein